VADALGEPGHSPAGGRTLLAQARLVGQAPVVLLLLVGLIVMKKKLHTLKIKNI
jgi:hypothetical protein